MGVIVEERDTGVKVRPFPKLMSHINGGGKVALFTSERVGTVLRKGTFADPVGYHCQQFDPKYWEDYKGSLILTNE